VGLDVVSDVQFGFSVWRAYYLQDTSKCNSAEVNQSLIATFSLKLQGRVSQCFKVS